MQPHCIQLNHFAGGGLDRYGHGLRYPGRGWLYLKSGRHKGRNINAPAVTAHFAGKAARYELLAPRKSGRNAARGLKLIQTRVDGTRAADSACDQGANRCERGRYDRERDERLDQSEAGSALIRFG